MITVHHLNNSCSQHILWLLEELGLEYDIKYYEQDPKMWVECQLSPVDGLWRSHPFSSSPPTSVTAWRILADV